MSNIHQNDELLRVQDQNYDIVFNYDKHENGGVAVHAEKDGKNHKVNPEYARAALVKQIGGSGWPSDLPKPSVGGYGYTTEVTNETGLICKRSGATLCHQDVTFPEGLIIGESYEVTVNGVTETYECFEDEGYPILGYPWSIVQLNEHGTWQIYGYVNSNENGIYAGMNLRPGETATIVISSREIILENNEPEVYESWSDEIQFPEGLIIGESYEVTVNGVTETYECFEDEGHPILGYPWSVMALYEHGTWQIFIDEGKNGNVIVAGMNLRPGETAMFIVKLLNKVRHPVEGKYLPEGGVGWTEQGVWTTLVSETVTTTIRNDDAPFAIGIFETQGWEIKNGATYKIVFNGVEYELTASTMNGVPFIGELEEIGPPNFNTYPFCIIQEARDSLIATEASGTYDVVIQEVTEIIHKIDGKYLPSGGDAIVVNVTYDAENNEWVSDKTYQELNAYANAGANIKCLFHAPNGPVVSVCNLISYINENEGER